MHRLSDDIYEMLKKKVADVYEECNILEFPIDPFKILSNYSEIVISKYSESNDIDLLRKISNDGFSFQHGCEWHIYYNDTISNLPRITQTILHEFAHYYLEHNPCNKSDEEEAEATFFAKYLLAPLPVIMQLPIPPTKINLQFNFGLGFQASEITLENYKKRVRFGPKELTEYEERIISQVEPFIERISSIIPSIEYSLW